ncbi:hypothetical protein [Herbidospora sp. NBRC 101105]|uniref:hypothetical protein n=1 Tax=Herbidospora sp. NBRC 101105 TaxID=3032195 RepID=UPI0024A34F61|nr:hypothetical protein [Herbidospora sp. NBRC 101105]GLX93136.1 hypothetical protein Hesp01_10860 [Herbidospora sp. NBRC 101105]
MLCLDCRTDTVPDWEKCPVCEGSDAAPAPEPSPVERRPIRWGDFLAAILVAGLNVWWLWILSTWWGSPEFWDVFWSQLTLHLVLIPTAVLLLFRRTAMFGAGVTLGHLALYTTVNVPVVIDVIWREPYHDDWWNGFVLAMTAAFLFFGIVWRDRLGFRATRRNRILAMAAVAIVVTWLLARTLPTRVYERWDGTTFECCTTTIIDAVDLVSVVLAGVLLALCLVLGVLSRSGAFGAGMVTAVLQGLGSNIATAAVSEGLLPAFWVTVLICAAMAALAIAKYVHVEPEPGSEVSTGHPASGDGDDGCLSL